jgi:hypothetical protein
VFDVRSQLGRAWLETAMADWADDGPVRIKMTAAHVARLERDWYCGRARFDPEPDGTALMTYGEDNLQAVFSVLRWLGPGAELVAPAPWRDAFAADLTAMLTNYQARAPLSSPKERGAAKRGGWVRDNLPAPQDARPSTHLTYCPPAAASGEKSVGCPIRAAALCPMMGTTPKAGRLPSQGSQHAAVQEERRC